jgi:hypothetical protein
MRLKIGDFKMQGWMDWFMDYRMVGLYGVDGFGRFMYLARGYYLLIGWSRIR